MTDRRSFPRPAHLAPLASSRLGTLAATLPLLLAACVDSTGPPHPLIEETEFAPELGIDLSEMTRIGGGMYVQDSVLGVGPELEFGREVRVAYDLYVPDGRHVLRQSEGHFVMGCRDVVAGLEAGISGMRVGGARRLVVPPRMGYGEQPPWGVDVPPHSILVYVVEALTSVPGPDPLCR